MRTRRDTEEYDYGFSDMSFEEDSHDEVLRKQQIRKKLEERLERKKLKEEIDEFDGDFDWDELDK